MWEKIKILSGVVAALVIPIALAYIGNQYSSALKERELQGKFVELAVDILREEPTPDTDSLRAWATKVIDRYSGVNLSLVARDNLIKRVPFPSSSLFKAPVWQDKTADVSAGDLQATVDKLKANGANEVIRRKQADGRYTVVGTRWRPPPVTPQ